MADQEHEVDRTDGGERPGRGGKVVVALGATIVAGCKGCEERRRRKLAEYNARMRDGGSTGAREDEKTGSGKE